MKEQDSALCGGKRVSEALKMARIAFIRRMVSSLKTGSQKERLCGGMKVKIMARTLRLQLIQMRFTEVSGKGEELGGSWLWKSPSADHQCPRRAR